MYLFHGSVNPDIQLLRAQSPLHGDAQQKVVYLTESEPYALFYIWDAAHNLKEEKHVTCRLHGGVVYYEEQFEGQLRAFYEGVSGWMYRIKRTSGMQPVDGREGMWVCPQDVVPEDRVFIPDVYAQIERCIEEGRVAVTRMPDDMRALLRQHLTGLILEKGLLKTPESDDARFYRTFFPDSWSDAMIYLQNK